MREKQSCEECLMSELADYSGGSMHFHYSVFTIHFGIALKRSCRSD